MLLSNLVLYNTFVDLSTTENPYSTMYIRIGHVEQHGVVQQYNALEVTLTYKTHNNIYKQVFIGQDMADKAIEWAYMMTHGHFGSENKDQLVAHINSVIKANYTS